MNAPDVSKVSHMGVMAWPERLPELLMADVEYAFGRVLTIEERTLFKMGWQYGISILWRNVAPIFTELERRDDGIRAELWPFHEVMAHYDRKWRCPVKVNKQQEKHL